MNEYEIKARELVDRFKKVTYDYTDGIIESSEFLDLKPAKQCALLCVDEIIREWDKFEIQDSGKIYNGNGQDYWRLVKQAINELQ